MEPTNSQLYNALETAMMVMGKERFCAKYLAAFKEGRLL
jgi:hypothetical protein